MLFLVWRSWLWIKASSSRGLKEVFPHIYGDHVYQIVGHGLRYSVVVWRWGEMRWSACTLRVFCLETWRAESSHLKYIFIICIKESRFTSASLTTELVGGGEEEEVWGGRAIQRLRNSYERARSEVGCGRCLDRGWRKGKKCEAGRWHPPYPIFYVPKPNTQ